MPAKTVVFTRCNKFDGKDFRWVRACVRSFCVLACVRGVMGDLEVCLLDREEKWEGREAKRCVTQNDAKPQKATTTIKVTDHNPPNQ
jgi:hypothetical protein